MDLDGPLTDVVDEDTVGKAGGNAAGSHITILQEAVIDLSNLFGDIIDVGPVQESTFTPSLEEVDADFDTLFGDKS